MKTTDNIHSIYVDQWDWEKIISKEDRNVETSERHSAHYLQCTAQKTEKYMAIQYDYIEEILPKDIFFITTQELEDMYPDLTTKGTGIQDHKDQGRCIPHADRRQALPNGEPHDGRAPDYDDWEL